eukprot:scaffold473448_cov51-Prasinocladus_malaysianus.AAC.1
MEPENIIDELLLDQGDCPLSDHEVLLVAADMFAAGTDTTSATLEWLLLLLALHPEAQQAVHEELDKVLGDSVPAEIDRSKLPVLTATLMEAMRFMPVVPLGVPHRATEDTEIGGYSIPKDTVIMTNNHGLTHDPTLWKSPEEFRPQRFLEEESTLKLQGAESRPSTDAYKFVPFGVLSGPGDGTD